jgi:hypothetical protein
MEGTENWCLEALNLVPEGNLLTLILMHINGAYSSHGSKKKRVMNHMNAKLVEKGSSKMHPVKKACFQKRWLSTEKGGRTTKKRSEFLPGCL